MNSIFSLLPEGGWQRFLCDAMWQSTLIAGLGLLAARFLVRQSAARAWLLLLTLTACALVPLGSSPAWLGTPRAQPKYKRHPAAFSAWRRCGTVSRPCHSRERRSRCHWFR